MQSYIVTKIVRAEHMDDLTFLREIKGKYEKNRKMKLGYKVISPEGYVYWLPQKTFEQIHRKLMNREKELI